MIRFHVTPWHFHYTCTKDWLVHLPGRNIVKAVVVLHIMYSPSLFPWQNKVSDQMLKYPPRTNFVQNWVCAACLRDAVICLW